MTHPLLTISPHEADAGNLIGRDPRTLTAAEFEQHLPNAKTGMKAIRAKCLDCAGGVQSEVSKCTAINCPLWPLRMGGQPKGMREARGFGVETDEVAA
jgi:hypothetical protein